MNLKELSINIRERSAMFAEVLQACRALLINNQLAAETRDYLDNRIATFYQNRFEFGYFPNNENLQKLIDIVGEEKLRALDLIYDKYVADADCMASVKQSVFTWHNLIMPYKDVYGNIVALVGRTLLSKEEQKKRNISKYKNSQFHKSLHIFGLHNSRRSIISNNCVILVEGQFDCISCHVHGFHNVVALGGVAFSKYQFALLSRYTNNIKLLLDNDSAGLNAANKIIERYSSFADIKKIQLPLCYKDVDEYLVKNDDYGILNFIG
jgi:DNA primase catalytic core